MEPDAISTAHDTRSSPSSLLVSIINSSPLGKILIDQNGIIHYVNQRVIDMFGYSQAQLIGSTLDALIPERYRNHHGQLIENYLLDPTNRAMGAGRDLTGLHSTGTEFPVEIGISPLETNEGRFVLAAIVDITERKRLELSLKQAIAHLEEFNYVVSHDLRSPLRGISDLINWIEEDTRAGNTQDIFKNINRIKPRIERMEKLIDDLLTYARAGRKSGETQLIDTHELIQNAIHLVSTPDTVNVVIETGLVHIHAAKTPLETVIRNLCANAIKHNDSHTPEIRISTQEAGNYCLFTVSDNGPGIPEIAKERVFKLFQTLKDGKDTNSGLGLALTRRLVESHGGKIELHVKDGTRGANFLVWWPRFARSDLDE